MLEICCSPKKWVEIFISNWSIPIYCIDLSPKSMPHNEFIRYWFKRLTNSAKSTRFASTYLKELESGTVYFML